MIRQTSLRPGLTLAAALLAATAAPSGAGAAGPRNAPTPAASAERPAQEGNQGTAAAAPANGPQRLGTFGDWTAATHSEGGGKVCYAFARMAGRQNALLTVTHRPQGRDQVALRIGRAFPRNAEVKVAVGTNELDFYTAGDNAFARDGHATVAAFRNGREAVAKSPAANNRSTTETFPLNGFTAAYEAISKECPATGGSTPAPATPRR